MKPKKPYRGVISLIAESRLNKMGCRKCIYLIEIEPDPEFAGYFLVRCDKGRFYYPPYEPVDWEVIPFKTPPPATECFREWHEKRYRG